WKYSFPDWMREVKRKRFPYVAQSGDHVVYFPVGHEEYLSEVVDNELYPIDMKMRPGSDAIKKEEIVFAVVEEVKYILKHSPNSNWPRLTLMEEKRAFHGH
ncbi:hypothetical protein PENTCL1PPCAC_23311, partial [Pristionchus entomophagus]